jgi:hypothetical protein
MSRADPATHAATDRRHSVFLNHSFSYFVVLVSRKKNTQVEFVTRRFGGFSVKMINFFYIVVLLILIPFIPSMLVQLVLLLLFQFLILSEFAHDAFLFPRATARAQLVHHFTLKTF